MSAPGAGQATFLQRVQRVAAFPRRALSHSGSRFEQTPFPKLLLNTALLPLAVGRTFRRRTP